MVYKKDDGFIGIVLGEIYPYRTYTDANWTFNLSRTDFQDSAAVYQIRLKEAGNCFRNLVAAEEPIARLILKRRGGR
ncbi:hypothetical protein SODALDRAFT_330540 [Sodiomyces alkalinus F11]|uniref:Uncharacterized protein n=1 Tax=Sodiomyces alkalinus (strain CBS 110278 / VKM F-3762 / F11) TaxID=1314773 RepID=A0A3N2Q227_SODAK|nr:hypothetical protein SODALDRAFT_330540 [Sodiomyces alkalinus F11]ROT40810.1 hypothetical protein SODALDRAFT_330540 [Sodiomyces alkalinus F11]